MRDLETINTPVSICGAPFGCSSILKHLSVSSLAPAAGYIKNKILNLDVQHTVSIDVSGCLIVSYYAGSPFRQETEST